MGFPLRNKRTLREHALTCTGGNLKRCVLKQIRPSAGEENKGERKGSAAESSHSTRALEDHPLTGHKRSRVTLLHGHTLNFCFSFFLSLILQIIFRNSRKPVFGVVDVIHSSKNQQQTNKKNLKSVQSAAGRANAFS